MDFPICQTVALKVRYHILPKNKIMIMEKSLNAQVYVPWFFAECAPWLYITLSQWCPKGSCGVSMNQCSPSELQTCADLLWIMNPGRRVPLTTKATWKLHWTWSYRKWPRLDRTWLSSAKTPHSSWATLLLLTHDPASESAVLRGYWGILCLWSENSLLKAHWSLLHSAKINAIYHI